MEEILASTAEVIRKLLIDNDFGVMPGIRQINPDMSLTVDPPQIFTRALPDEINYAILIKTIAGRSWSMVSDGEPRDHTGINVLCRAPITDRELDDIAYHTAHSVYRFLGKIQNQSVTVGQYTFNIQSIYRTLQVIDAGEQAEKSRTDWVFEANVVYAIPPYTLTEG